MKKLYIAIFNNSKGDMIAKYLAALTIEDAEKQRKKYESNKLLTLLSIIEPKKVIEYDTTKSI